MHWAAHSHFGHQHATHVHGADGAAQWKLVSTMHPCIAASGMVSIHMPFWLPLNPLHFLRLLMHAKLALGKGTFCYTHHFIPDTLAAHITTTSTRTPDQCSQSALPRAGMGATWPQPVDSQACSAATRTPARATHGRHAPQQHCRRLLGPQLDGWAACQPPSVWEH